MVHCRVPLLPLLQPILLKMGLRLDQALSLNIMSAFSQKYSENENNGVVKGGKKHITMYSRLQRMLCELLARGSRAFMRTVTHEADEA